MKTIESMSLDIYSLSDDEHDIESKPIITIDSTNEPNRQSKLSRHRTPANQQPRPPQSFTQQLTTSYPPPSIPSTSTATPLTTKYEHHQHQHQPTQLMETSLMIVNTSTSASTSSSLHHHQHHHRQEYIPPVSSTTIQIGPPSPSEIVLSPAKLGQ